MTKDKPAHLKYPLETQLAEVQRELAMRRRVYPRFVESHKITQEQASERLDILASTAALLQWLLDEQHATQLARDGAL